MYDSEFPDGFIPRRPDSPSFVQPIIAPQPVVTSGDGRPVRSPRAMEGGTGGSTADNIIMFPNDLVASTQSFFTGAQGKLLAFENAYGLTGWNWVGLIVIGLLLWWSLERS